MTVIDLIKELNKRTKSKNLVFYSNKNKLTNYEFLDVYENEGQVEIHISEGENLEKLLEIKGYNRIETIDDLKKQSQNDDMFEGFILLNLGCRSSKRISYHKDNDSWFLINEIDDSESNYDSTRDFIRNEDNIAKAIKVGSFYQYP
tara:strand:- start:224 stop:661 length:438 start_codon:yes stop_codon:yes gene_type:complete